MTACIGSACRKTEVSIQMHYSRNTVTAIAVIIGSLLIPQHIIAQADAAQTAQTAEPRQKVTLTADDAVELALQTHIDIKRSQITLKQTQRESSHSWNSLLPSIKATASGSRQGALKSENKTAQNTQELSAGLSASLTIDSGLGAKIKKLKSAYQAQQASYEDTVRSTESAVRQSFYNLLYLKEKVAAAKSTLESYQSQYDQTKNKYDRGVVPELDLLTAQVNLETSKPDVDSALASYYNTLHEFLNTIGLELPFSTDVELSGSLDDAETVQRIGPEVIKGCEDKSPAVRQLQDALRTAEYAKQYAYNSAYLPSLTLGANIFPEFHSKNLETSDSSDKPYWNVSIGISLPLDSWIYGSSARDTVAAQDDTIQDYKLQIADKKKTVRTSIIEKLTNIETSQKTLKARHLNLELAEKSYKMTEEAYQRGTKDLLALQSSLDTLHSARLQLREEQYTLLKNVLELENELSLASGTYFTTTSN